MLQFLAPAGRSSPRMWGCFFKTPVVCSFRNVFPTHVGVFLPLMPAALSVSGLPHACGGVSTHERVLRHYFPSSPRMWGCFRGLLDDLVLQPVFPTHVGVFPRRTKKMVTSPGLPHACGGVSVYFSASCPLLSSSPRMWGCFHRGIVLYGHGLVFPTHVGVFLSRTPQPACRGCLPHACGGVSMNRRDRELVQASSPRMWGCFRDDAARRGTQGVFPTHVGVFPSLS